MVVLFMKNSGVACAHAAMSGQTKCTATTCLCAEREPLAFGGTEFPRLAAPSADVSHRCLL